MPDTGADSLVGIGVRPAHIDRSSYEAGVSLGEDGNPGPPTLNIPLIPTPQASTMATRISATPE
jgi:hypothetical protein